MKQNAWQSMRSKRRSILLLIAVSLSVAVIATLLLAVDVNAEIASTPGEFDSVAERLPVHQQLDQEQPPIDFGCRLCHGDSNESVTFPSGETLPVMVDLAALDTSAHADLSCTNCHRTSLHQIPHEPLEVADLRSYEIGRSATCERCHVEPHITSQAGAESQDPVLCTDCHGAHDVLTVQQWQQGEGTGVCVDCHLENEVAQSDPMELSQIVRDGMFAERVNETYCLACHGQPDLSLTFANGDVLPLTIDQDAFHDSVHGTDNPWQQLDCVDCHGRYTYPHLRVLPESAREYSLENYTNCIKCHEQNYERTQDSVHQDALEEGNLNAAVCTDCHGTHYVPPPDMPRERISQTCQQCHSTIYEQYAQSVHGEALLADSNPDVATCINCHGVHNISDPTTQMARNRSPELCATCHADEALMAKYDVSTDVFETYVADFHGTTVKLFEQSHPDAEVNEAVCYDCHGVHDIRPTDDPQNGIKANLLETCRQCHPDASENFPDAWTSHFVPSLDNNTLVYLVDLFYKMVIPATVGFFGFLVGTDIYRRIREKLGR